MRRNKQPTHTSKVMQYLTRPEVEFATVNEISAAVGSTTAQVNSALHALRHYLAVDVVVQQGVGWWFACPGDDTRTKIVEERTPEDGPRRRRKLLRSHTVRV